MEKKVYGITFKETTIDTEDMMDVESGVFDYGFDNIKDAKDALADIAQRRVDLIDEDDEEEMDENWNEDRTSISITYHGNTYEYAVKEIIIGAENDSFPLT